MTALTAGTDNWMNRTITQIRLDFGTSSSDVFDVDWIAVGRIGPIYIDSVNMPVLVGANAFTDIVALTGESASVSWTRSSDPMAATGKDLGLEVLSWTNSTGASVDLELSVDSIVSRSSTGGGTAYVYFYAQTSSLSDYEYIDLPDINRNRENVPTPAGLHYVATYLVTLANGATLYVYLRAQINPALSSTVSVDTSGTDMRITAVKR
jgi:hypothetical protein